MSARPTRVIYKIGSSLLIGQDGGARRAWLKTVVADIAEEVARGIRPIVVSSGAIALGARRLGLDGNGRESLSDAQAAASVGQIALAGLWSELLGAHELTAAQLLLTLDDMEDRRRYLNASATLDTLLERGVVPVINENDSVATDEIRFGDNDRLAARVAQAVQATRVVLLSDVDGLYDRRPDSDTHGQFMAVVERVDDDIRAMVDSGGDGTGSGVGTGGMAAKLEAARIASLAGAELVVASGLHDHPIARLRTSGVGTVFRAQRSESARKNWLGGRKTNAGSITVDAGAVEALRDGGSLLPAGVITIDGQFERSDVVEIRGPDGAPVALGMTEYDALDCAKIMGRHSSELEALLDHVPRSAVVHRNQMVLL